MSDYRKIDSRIWNDEKFLSLSGSKPSGQSCFIHLITNRYMSIVPGLYHAYAESLARDIRWPLDEYFKVFDEIAQAGMVKADWSVGVISIPSALKHNPPDNQSIVIGWSKIIPSIPRCPIREDHVALIKDFLKDWKSGSYLEAFEDRLHLTLK